MGLQRVHRTDNREHFGPVRLGAQDLRDVAAVFADLEARVHLRPTGLRTRFVTEEHETEDVEDVLAFPDADTLPSVHALSGEMLLSIHAGRDGTIIDRSRTPSATADWQAVEEAADKLRRIVQSRELGRFETLRQRGPGKGLLIVLLTLPAVALAGGQPLLDVWLTRATSHAVTAVVVWLSVVLQCLLFAGRPRDLIRLRGEPKPWWEQRQGLIALVGVAVAVVMPFVVLALDRGRR